METEARNGDKFNSIGNAKTQIENAALVIKLVGEIGIKPANLSHPDLLFLIDVRDKLNQSGNKMFGAKQVANVVRIHREVMNARRDKGQCPS